MDYSPKKIEPYWQDLWSKEKSFASEKSDKNLASDAFKIAQPEMHRAVTKGVFKKNTISRKLSRLSARIKKIA